MGKVLKKLHGLKPSGSTDFVSGVQVATLLLKHRESKNHRQRIVAFVDSPITADEAELVKLAKKLKKNNVAVDIVNFGEEDTNTPKLEAFIAAVNGKDDASRLITVPSGARILSDVLLSSPLIGGGSGGDGGCGSPRFGPRLPVAVRPPLWPTVAPPPIFLVGVVA